MRKLRALSPPHSSSVHTTSTRLASCVEDIIGKAAKLLGETQGLLGRTNAIQERRLPHFRVIQRKSERSYLRWRMRERPAFGAVLLLAARCFALLARRVLGRCKI